jgi:hypothetical protein
MRCFGTLLIVVACASSCSFSILAANDERPTAETPSDESSSKRTCRKQVNCNRTSPATSWTLKRSKRYRLQNLRQGNHAKGTANHRSCVDLIQAIWGTMRSFFRHEFETRSHARRLAATIAALACMSLIRSAPFANSHSSHLVSDTVMLSEAKHLWLLERILFRDDQRFFASLRMTSINHSNS